MNASVDAPLATKKLLVLEDEFFISMTLERYLLSSGAEIVDCVGTVKDAVNLADETQYDAAVLDVRLPDGESYELAQDLLEKGCAVIFHSGHAEESLTKHVPTSFFCSKPCSAEQLTNVTTKAIRETAARYAKTS